MHNHAFLFVMFVYASSAHKIIAFNWVGDQIHLMEEGVSLFLFIYFFCKSGCLIVIGIRAG